MRSTCSSDRARDRVALLVRRSRARTSGPACVELTMRVALALGVALLFASPALAQCPAPPDPLADQCHFSSVAFQHVDRALPSISLDSGWIPSGSPIQVHFAFL